MSRFIMKKSSSRKLIAIALLAVIISISLPRFSLAQTSNIDTTPPKIDWTNCLQSLPSCSLYFIMWAITKFMALFIGIGAWLVNFTLSLGKSVINTPAVQTGFSVALAIANLGFVLGIIVIALATILRRETYGIKQLLWKLIFMAIIVNFGLVISGVILNFSDSLTQYFMTPMGGSNKFTDTLVNKIAPQTLFAPPKVGGGPPSCALLFFSPPAYFGCKIGEAAVERVAKETAGTDAKEATDYTQAVMAMVFIVVFEFIVAFTLIALGIMLLLRFLWLAFLLILLPLAWVMWVFPKFSHYFSQWWGHFLRWVFFPAISTFFLFLAVQTVTKSSFLGSYNTDPLAALGAATSNPVIIAVAAQMILVCGLALGGLFAANSLSIKGASVAIGTMKGVGGAIKGRMGSWTKNKYERTKSYAARTETGRKAVEAAQRAGTQWGQGQRGFKGAAKRFAGRFMAPVRKAGEVAAESRVPTENMVKEAQRKYGKMSLEEQARRVSTSRSPAENLAIMTNLKDAAKSKDPQVKAAAAAALASIPKSIHDRFDRLNLLYGRGKGQYQTTGPQAGQPQPGAMPETFAGDKQKSLLDEFRDRMEARKNKGGDVSEEEKHFEELVKLEREGNLADEKARRALDGIREKIERREGKGEDVSKDKEWLEDMKKLQREALAQEKEQTEEARKQTAAQENKPGAQILTRVEERGNVRSQTKFDAQGNVIEDESEEEKT